jgi:uncharacterized protein (TIGR00269 family)
MKCSVCNQDAIIEIRYNRSALCSEHFADFFESRVKRELRKQIHFRNKKGTISVAISGGKDSSVTLYVLRKFYQDWKEVKITAFTIDEGISGYRSSGLESAKNLCRELGVEHSVVSFKERNGYTMDEIVKIDPNGIPCAHCGPMRRQLMNEAAERQHADYVALGINLDDYSQSILMNVAKGDVARMARLAPHSRSLEGLTPRIVPLRTIPEREVVIYAMIKGIRFDSSWCPYYARAHRNTFREVIDILEERSPGTRQAMLSFYEGIKDGITNISASVNLKTCRNCGSPTTEDLCVVCRDLEFLKRRESLMVD